MKNKIKELLNKDKKINKLLKIVIVMLGILILLLIVDNLDLGYATNEPSITCDERKNTNEFLIKTCKENGGDIKITYFQNGKTIQSIECK